MWPFVDPPHQNIKRVLADCEKKDQQRGKPVQFMISATVFFQILERSPGMSDTLPRTVGGDTGLAVHVKDLGVTLSTSNCWWGVVTAYHFKEVVALYPNLVGTRPLWRLE